MRNGKTLRSSLHDDDIIICFKNILNCQSVVKTKQFHYKFEAMRIQTTVNKWRAHSPGHVIYKYTIVNSHLNYRN